MVRQNFPTSKWKMSHYAYYKSKIKTGRIAVPGISPDSTNEDAMPEPRQLARTVTNEQRDVARKILDDIEGELERCSNGDPSIAFRMRRYIHARLQLKNRGSTEERRKLRAALLERQGGHCAICHEPIQPSARTDLHRTGSAGYTEANTILAHSECHAKHHLQHGGIPEFEE